MAFSYFAPFFFLREMTLFLTSLSNLAIKHVTEFMWDAYLTLKSLPLLQVTEFAKDDNSMEEKRRRSAAKYEENNTPKRRKTAE